VLLPPSENSIVVNKINNNNNNTQLRDPQKDGSGQGDFEPHHSLASSTDCKIYSPFSTFCLNTLSWRA